MIPGIDGVGRAATGELLYFVLPDTTLGAMAEQTLVDRRRSVVLPAGSDPAAIAAGMNPAMSSWIALRKRIEFKPGASVLVLGAAGNAGRMAVEVAKHLGAGQVIAAARNPKDTMVSLDALGEVATDVDVVLDYLWGEPTVNAMTALITHRSDDGQALDWIRSAPSPAPPPRSHPPRCAPPTCGSSAPDRAPSARRRSSASSPRSPPRSTPERSRSTPPASR